MAKLFSPIKLRGLEIRNRIFMAPMCQYSATDGLPNSWHQVHYGARAVGGAGMVMVEFTAVVPEGRISPGDVGMWSDAHTEAFAPITRFVKEQGAVPGIQLAHAGRKASANLPWLGGGPLSPGEGAWQTLGPSPVAFTGFPTPREMTVSDIDAAVEQFAAAARYSLAAGFEVVEIHMAHGYLLHEFLSPLSNHRVDDYGGSLENRMRLPLRVAQAVRRAWPAELPVLVRISATDWMDGGWDLTQSVELARHLKEIGIDLIDCSSGGLVAEAMPPFAPGFQVTFAAEIRKQTGIATSAVGIITDPAQAEDIVASGHADAVCLGRELLRNPQWPLHAARSLGAEISWPRQYERAKP
jgi:2,4-dienoyl-CoA reductase-like NADH-dependent reductase (Old Yellow Enzyme family)